MSLCFFFQAEDGIRDHCVTGVQTCALPIYVGQAEVAARMPIGQALVVQPQQVQDGGLQVVQVDAILDRVIAVLDRKSTRLNSSHTVISYAVFCLKKKKKKLYNIC